MPGFKPKIYIKDESYDPIYRVRNNSFYFKSRIFPGLLMAVGILTLSTQVALPLVLFKTRDEVSKPVESTVLGVASGFREFEFKELEEEINLNNRKENYIPDYFYITIPKLKIEDAMIETNSKNLSPDESLGHYNGSALPGEHGNTFIYGHSVLPWFYNPNNYKTIFSTLDKLTTGDIFYIKYNNKQYTYKVENTVVKAVDEINPLAEIKPTYLNESTTVLMTCWPAGTKAKRLMVNAVLVE